MTREEAIAWYRSIPPWGSYPQRSAYIAEFPVGEIARDLWNSGEFTLGVDYGIMIAIVTIFALTPEDFKG